MATTHKALVLTSTSVPPTIQTLPIPQPTPGSVVARILFANVGGYTREIYNGVRSYPFPTPLTIGTSAIGRITSTGPDTTLLAVGQLVFIDSYIRGRDDGTAGFLFGVHEGFTDGSRKLMSGEWRDATYAEYAKLPLENCHPLNESLLCEGEGGMRLRIEDLADISRLVVPYGGLADIALKAGETIIVAPATGPFGGAAVKVALAMGARVIAMGRNLSILQHLAESNERVETVQITGDVEADTKALQQFGPVDAYFDISPPAAGTSTHIKSGILALRHGGRVSLMGGIYGDVAIPHSAVMHKDLMLKGKWMYSRENVRKLIQMVEVGVLKLGEANGQRVVAKFTLEDWEKAFTTAAEDRGLQCLIAP